MSTSSVGSGITIEPMYGIDGEIYDEDIFDCVTCEEQVELKGGTGEGVHIVVPGSHEEYDTKGCDRRVKRIREKVMEMLSRKPLKGPLKLSVVYVIEAKKLAAYPSEHDLVALAKFTMEVLKGVLHRDSGQYVEVDFRKELGNTNETNIFVEKVAHDDKGGMAESMFSTYYRGPMQGINSDSWSYEEDAKSGTHSSEVEGLEAVDILVDSETTVAAIVHQAPMGYRVKHQDREREEFGAQMNEKRPKKNSDGSTNLLKGEISGYFEYGLLPNKKKKEKIQKYKEKGMVCIHKSQPDLGQLLQFTVESLKDTVYSHPQQISHIRAKKAMTDAPKTGFIIGRQQDAWTMETITSVFEARLSKYSL